MPLGSHRANRRDFSSSALALDFVDARTVQRVVLMTNSIGNALWLSGGNARAEDAEYYRAPETYWLTFARHVDEPAVLPSAPLDAR